MSSLAFLFLFNRRKNFTMLKKFKVPVAGWGVSLSLKKLQSKSYTFPTQKRSTVINFLFYEYSNMSKQEVCTVTFLEKSVSEHILLSSMYSPIHELMLKSNCVPFCLVRCTFIFSRPPKGK